MNYMNYTDSAVIRFLKDKISLKESTSYYGKFETDHEAFQYIYQHLKEAWYGLMVADLREHNRPEVDNFIKKHKHKWNDELWGSIFFSQRATPYDEIRIDILKPSDRIK